jgi:protein TonB
MPNELYKPTPVYPEAALRNGISGRVLIKIGIDRKGNVKSARVLEKLGFGLDEEALAKIWKYKFSPAKRANGEPVDIVINYSFRFNLPTP